jgi:hypothetical protein
MKSHPRAFWRPTVAFSCVVHPTVCVLLERLDADQPDDTAIDAESSGDSPVNAL